MKDVLLAKVAVSAANFSIDKPYTYQIPETFAQQVTVGMRVLVPFGRGNRHTEGLVLALEQQEALPPRCKRILTALDDRPVLYQAMGTASPSAALRELVKGEVLTLETSVSRGVGDKTELVAQLAVPYVQAQERISPRAKQQQAAAAFLDEYPVAS